MQFFLEQLNPALDRISIRDYIKEVEIGAFQVERDLTQRVKFNVVVEVSASTSSSSDDVDGSNLKAPVNSGTNPRRVSFAARFGGMKGLMLKENQQRKLWL